MYHVTVDSGKRLICLTAVGFVDAAEYAQLDAEMGVAVARLKKESERDFAMLLDLREAALLTMEQADHFRQQMDGLFGNGLRKAAFVTTSALVRMQVTRSISPAKSRLFTANEEALSWLAD